MNQRKKQRVSTRPPKTTPTKAHGSWWFVTIPITGLVLLAVALNLPKRKTMNRLQAKPDSNAPVAVGEKVNAVLPTPPDRVRTNETESDNIDRATDLVNRGTDLLDKGKIDEAVADF